MAEEINNSNEENMKAVLTKPALALAGVFVIAILLGICNLKPALETYASTNSTYKSTLSDKLEKEKTLKDLKDSAELLEAQKNSEAIATDKGFFKPMESGSDPDVIIAGEFNEILSLITANQIKTRSVKYEYAPAGDPFFDYASAKFGVCRLDMEMISNYTNFKNFLKDLYKHEHYLDIAKVEIEPYQKDKSILLIKFQLKLYAEKA